MVIVEGLLVVVVFATEFVLVVGVAMGAGRVLSPITALLNVGSCISLNSASVTPLISPNLAT